MGSEVAAMNVIDGEYTEGRLLQQRTDCKKAEAMVRATSNRAVGIACFGLLGCAYDVSST